MSKMPLIFFIFNLYNFGGHVISSEMYISLNFRLFIYVLYKIVVHILMIIVLNNIYSSILIVININTTDFLNMYLNLHNDKEETQIHFMGFQGILVSVLMKENQ